MKKNKIHYENHYSNNNNKKDININNINLHNINIETSKNSEIIDSNIKYEC